MNQMICSVLLFLAILQTCMAGQFINYTYAGRDNMVYIPTAAGSSPLPLFVMLHGCSQDPQDFATGTKMNTYAESHNFFVVYPQQPLSANVLKCWNWFDIGNQTRGSGEPAIIVSIVDSIIANYSIDSSQIYVGGLSAGAAMSVILGVTYPDVFRGATVSSATSVAETVVAQFVSGGPDPVVQGKVSFDAMSSFAQTFKVLVVHGTADAVVIPVNGQQVVTSLAKAFDYVIGNGVAKGVITNEPTTNSTSQVPGGRFYSTFTYANSISGETLIKYITVTNMSHAWSGGSSAGSYTDSQGPDASYQMVQFFLNTTSSTSTTSTSSTSTSTTSGNSTSTSTTTSSASSVASVSFLPLFMAFIYCLYL